MTRFVLFNQVVAVRREALETTGGFNEGLQLLEDYDLAMRLSVLGGWGIISEPLVIKYNDTRGVGVVAMRDPTQVLAASATVLGGLLSERLHWREGIRDGLQNSLTKVRRQIRINDHMSSDRRSVRLQGRIQFEISRFEEQVRRKLPGYPTADISPLSDD